MVTGGQATQARLSSPAGVALDSSGNLYIADTGNYRIRKVDSSGTITTIAGNGMSYYGTSEGFPAVNKGLSRPLGVAVDSSSNVYIADSRENRIFRVDSSGIINTFAGVEERGYSGGRKRSGQGEFVFPH